MAARKPRPADDAVVRRFARCACTVTRSACLALQRHNPDRGPCCAVCDHTGQETTP